MKPSDPIEESPYTGPPDMPKKSVPLKWLAIGAAAVIVLAAFVVKALA